ncbi:MAG: YdbH domain-containing protein, partial [Verrucomicrobiae bacterium]|nr:YdbH domain-containing protein [Verrucomicrobiae bacterium]
DLHRLEMPGVRVATLRGEFTGGTKHLDLRLPALELVAGGRWTFRNLVGQLTTPLNAEAGLTLAGEVAGNWASNLVAGNWLPLTIAARRSGEQISGTLALALTNLAMPAFVALPAGGVSGRVFLSGESSPDRSAGSLELDLALPEAACFGWRLRHLRIAGDARLALGAPKSPLLPGFLLRFLQAAPALAPERLVECFFTLRATAGRMSLAQSMAIEGLALTLSRTPEASGNPSQPASWATLAARVVRITAGGFELVDTGIEGFLEAETARFVGSTSLAGSRIPFEVRVQTGAGNPDASGLNGRLQLGPWRMEDFRLPAALTDGDDVRLTGSLMLAGDWQTGPDARWNFAPTLTLNLERLDWPDRRFTIENLQGELALTGLDPPTSSAPQRVDLGRIRFEDHELTQVEADLTLSGENGLQLELRRAAYLDGRVWSEPVRWNWRTGDLGLVLHAEGVDLHRLGTLLPHWEGTLSGRIEGRIPLQRNAARWRLQGGRLELDRRVPARLEYPADGLLTGGMAPDAPRYQQLRMVEDGLKHLTIQTLRVDLFDPQTPQTAVRVRLEGTSTSARAIVPVILNLNLNGPLEDLIELIHTDRLEFSF